jgi:nicotinamide riboside kinase
MSKKIRRINICAGPGCGKSTIAAQVYSSLKTEGRSIELATEYVKGWAYLKREINPFDQFYLLNKQLQEEYVPLVAGVELVITDSPLILPYCYATLDFSTRVADALLPIIEYFDEEYPALYIYLNRGTKYCSEGRFQDENKAREIDARIKSCLEIRNKKFIEVNLGDDIVGIVKDYLDGVKTIN